MTKILLPDGVIAFRYCGKCDIRCYKPPVGYTSTADLIDVHPKSGKRMFQSQWWIFLTPKIYGK